MSRARIYKERLAILTEIREELDAIEIFYKMHPDDFKEIRYRLDLIQEDYVGPLWESGEHE